MTPAFIHVIVYSEKLLAYAWGNLHLENVGPISERVILVEKRTIMSWNSPNN